MHRPWKSWGLIWASFNKGKTRIHRKSSMSMTRLSWRSWVRLTLLISMKRWCVSTGTCPKIWGILVLKASCLTRLKNKLKRFKIGITTKVSSLVMAKTQREHLSMCRLATLRRILKDLAEWQTLWVMAVFSIEMRMLQTSTSHSL